MFNPSNEHRCKIDIIFQITKHYNKKIKGKKRVKNQYTICHLCHLCHLKSTHLSKRGQNVDKTHNATVNGHHCMQNIASVDKSWTSYLNGKWAPLHAKYCKCGQIVDIIFDVLKMGLAIQKLSARPIYFL